MSKSRGREGARSRLYSALAEIGLAILPGKGGKGEDSGVERFLRGKRVACCGVPVPVGSTSTSSAVAMDGCTSELYFSGSGGKCENGVRCFAENRPVCGVSDMGV